MARLGDVCDILNGFAFKSEKYVDSGIRIIRIANVQKGFIEDSAPVFYPADDVNAQKYKLEEGDILVSLTGNVGRVGVLSEVFLPAALNQRVACLRIKSDVELDRQYLFNVLDSDTFERKCVEAAKGLAQKNLSSEWLKNYELSLPPYNDQIKIAQTLDKILSLISMRKEQMMKLDELIKSRFSETFDNITETVSLSNYIKELVAGKSLAGEVDCRNKVLKTGAVTYDFFDAAQVKSLPIDYSPQTEHRVKTGDVIISRMNTAELVGATGYVWSEPINTYLPDRLWRAELRPNTNPIFIWQLLIHPNTKRAIRAIASGTSGSMKNISKERLLQLQVKAVTFDQQNQFATFVEQTNKSIIIIQQSLKKLETLKKSLTQQYF